MMARLQTLLTRAWWQPQPSLLARALWPLSGVYRVLLALHRWRQPAPAPLPVPVLVVGNQVVGGAGKTPTVIAVVQALQHSGHVPGVITRGHGRKGAQALGVHEVEASDDPHRSGDEPLLIRRRCQVPVWVGRQRARAAAALCRAHPEVDVLVSDDGLQHRALARVAELVVFDERGTGNGWLLPAGPLREPLGGPVPAHRRVLYTAGVSSTALPGSLALRSIASAWPLPAWQSQQADAAQPLESLRGRTLLALAGIGAPEKFFGMLEAAGLHIERLPLPDHFDFNTLPWPAGTAELIITEKDAVKLARHDLSGTTVWVVPLDLGLPEALLGDLLSLLFPTAHP
jgi:tetraacyldisaccharide 4'-kinase